MRRRRLITDFLSIFESNNQKFPWQLPGASLVIDPSDGSHELHQGFFYSNPVPGDGTAGGAGRTQWHTVDGSDSSTDFASYSTASFEIWANNWSVRADRGYLGNMANGTTNGGGWGIASGAVGSNAVRFIASTDANSGGYAMATTQDPFADTGTFGSTNNTAVAHIVVTYNAGTVTIYVNGTSRTLTITGVFPATLFSPAGRPLLSIGRCFTNLYSSLDSVVPVCRIWKGKVLSAGEVTALWNSGKPQYYADMASGVKGSELVLAVEKGGTTCVHTGKTLTASGGPIATGYVATAIRDKSTLRLALTNNFGAAMHWQPAGLNGKPCFASSGGRAANGLASSSGSYFGTAHRNFATVTAGYFSTASGALLAANQWDQFAPFAEKWITAYEDTGSAIKYVIPGYQTNALDSNRKTPSLRVRDSDGTPNGNFWGGSGAGEIVTTNLELHEWYNDGVATGYLRNGTTKTVTPTGPGANDWFSQVSGINRVCLGGFAAGDTGPQKIGRVWQKIGVPTAAERAAARKWINDHYAIY